MGNQIESSVIEEHPIIENRISCYWEIWVLYRNGSREKLGAAYRYEFVLDSLAMLRADTGKNVVKFYQVQVAK